MNRMLRGLAGLATGLTLLGSSVLAGNLPKGFEDYRKASKFFEIGVDSNSFYEILDTIPSYSGKSEDRKKVTNMIKNLMSKLENKPVNSSINIRMYLKPGKKGEAVEISNYRCDDSGKMILENPFIYWFDKNNDGKVG